MNKILSAWGIEFESNQVIADRACGSLYQSQNSSNPVVLSITEVTTNENHTLMRLGRDFLMYFSGVFDVSEGKVKVETLIESSKSHSWLIAERPIVIRIKSLKTLKPQVKSTTLALRLSGRFVTAFPKGVTKEEF